MTRMTKVSPLPGYRLAMEFDDGIAGTVELESRLFGPGFANAGSAEETNDLCAPLRDEKFFAQVSLDEFGAPYWPNAADIAPDAMYAALTGPTDIARSRLREHSECREDGQRQAGFAAQPKGL
jgi:hypothetical protein